SINSSPVGDWRERSTRLPHEVERVNTRGFHWLAGSIRPDHGDLVGVLAMVETKRHGQLRLRKIAAGRHHLTPERPAADAKPDPRADGVAIAPGPDQPEPQAVMV